MDNIMVWDIDYIIDFSLNDNMKIKDAVKEYESNKEKEE